jgi:putative ABC transport system permease protein
MNATTMKVWRDLTRRKIRTLLVVLSIAVGVLGVNTVLGTGERLSSRLRDNYLAANPADIIIFTGPLSPGAIAELGAIANVIDLEGALVFNTRWQWDGQWQPLMIEASLDPASRRIDVVTLTSGQNPQRGSLLLERTAQNIAPVEVGQAVQVQGPSGDLALTIGGFGHSATHPPAAFSGVAVAFITLDEAERLLGQSSLNVVRVKLADLDAAEETTTALHQWFQDRGVPVLSLAVRDPQDFPGRSGVQSILLLMSLLGVLALLLSGFLVINTITTILAAETAQIGTMKAIGGTAWTVLGVYLALVLGYGLLGSLIGVALGTATTHWLAGYIARLANVDPPGFAVSSLATGVSLSVGLVTPLAAAWIPTWLGTRITVREAMTTYGIGSRTGRLEQFLARAPALPLAVSLPLRNALRRKGRALLTVTTLAMAGIAFIAVQATGTSLARSLDILTDTYNADVLVELDLPVETAQLWQITQGAPPVTAVEAWLDARAEVNDQRVVLNGVPVDTSLYKRNISSGRWFQPGDHAVIILPEKFALDHQLTVGDLVAVRLGAGLVEWEVVGTVRDYNESGNAPLAPYEQVADAFGWAGHANALLVQAAVRDEESVAELAAALAAGLPRLGVQGSVSTMQDVRQQAQAGFQVIVLFLMGMVTLVTLVGALGLLGTLTINVTERKREIGVMRSIGASSGAVIQLFWFEGLCLGLIGWGVAAAIGYPLARLFTKLLSEVLIPIEFYLPAAGLLWLGLGMILVTSLASIGPALAAAQTKVSDIIRYA